MALFLSLFLSLFFSLLAPPTRAPCLLAPPLSAAQATPVLLASALPPPAASSAQVVEAAASAQAPTPTSVALLPWSAARVQQPDHGGSRHRHLHRRAHRPPPLDLRALQGVLEHAAPTDSVSSTEHRGGRSRDRCHGRREGCGGLSIYRTSSLPNRQTVKPSNHRRST